MPIPINKKSSKFHRITIRNRKCHAAPLADEAFLELGDKAHAPGRVVKELEAALDVLDLDGLGLALLGEEGGGGDEVAGVAQAGLGADLGEQGQGVGREVNFLLLRADGEDLADLVALVGVRADDDDAVEEVEGEAVRGAVGGASDPRVAPVAGHDHDGGQFVFEGAVDVGEAFDVEHVDFVDEEDARHDFGFAFFFPFPDFGVDLVADLATDLTRVAREEGEESLCSGIYDVDFVQADCVDDFFSLLQFTIWALHKLGICPHCIVVP